MMRKGTSDAKMLEQLLDDIVATYIDLNVKSKGGDIDDVTCFELAKD